MSEKQTFRKNLYEEEDKRKQNTKISAHMNGIRQATQKGKPSMMDKGPGSNLYIEPKNRGFGTDDFKSK